MKSFLANANNIQKQWLLVDATDAVLGRLSTKLATILMGKHKPTYTPNFDAGDHVIVINADKIRVTGKKAQQKEYDYYTNYPGGHKYVSFAEMFAKKPERVLEMAVRRMMPRNALSKDMMLKLKIYKGSEHEHQAQKPVKINLFDKKE
jgi:large subunit ribosomal protein L13